MICEDGVRAVADDGSGVEKVSEKRVSNLVCDVAKGDYHYVLPDGRLDQSLPAELLSEAEKERTPQSSWIGFLPAAKPAAGL